MSKDLTSRERFLAACRREPLDAPPGWVMRQAGRYLPEYRALREGKTFLDMVHAPEIAAELTCQPLRRFDMDAAVIFSDILVPPAAMGLLVEFVPGRGPVLDPPVRTREGVERLISFDAGRATGFVADAIRLVRNEIGPDKAIIGFCGAPYTVASYMVEGQSSKNYEHTKALMLGEPEVFQALLARIVDAQLPYLAMQVDAGADVLQIFDSWGGALDAETYREVVLPHMTRLVAGAQACGVPAIVYMNGCAHLLEVLVETGADVLGIDWRIAPEDAIARVGDRVGIQGNLDPCTLYAPQPVVEAAVNRVLDLFEGQAGYIFNLGSGILPSAPIESMETVFRVLRERR